MALDGVIEYDISIQSHWVVGDRVDCATVAVESVVREVAVESVSV